jgi:hypothetical protein
MLCEYQGHHIHSILIHKILFINHYYYSLYTKNAIWFLDMYFNVYDIFMIHQILIRVRSIRIFWDPDPTFNYFCFVLPVYYLKAVKLKFVVDNFAPTS